VNELGLVSTIVVKSEQGKTYSFQNGHDRLLVLS
jgi:hypothetical protein